MVWEELYPSPIWTGSTYLPTLCSGRRIMRKVASLVQALINFGIVYFLIIWGWAGLTGTEMLIINGLDFTSLGGIALLGLGLYLAPFLLLTGLMMLVDAFLN